MTVPSHLHCLKEKTDRKEGVGRGIGRDTLLVTLLSIKKKPKSKYFCLTFNVQPKYSRFQKSVPTSQAGLGSPLILRAPVFSSPPFSNRLLTCLQLSTRLLILNSTLFFFCEFPGSRTVHQGKFVEWEE